MNFRQFIRRLRARLEAFGGPVREWLRRRLHALEPSPRTARWMGWTSLAAVMALGAWIGAAGLHLRFGIVVDALAGALIGFVFFALGWLGVAAGMWLVTFLRRHWTLAGLAAAVALVVLAGMFGLPRNPALAAGLALGLVVVLLGTGIGLLAQGRRRAGGFALVPSLAVLGFLGWWLAGDGVDTDPVAGLVGLPEHDGAEFAGLLEPGPHAVGFLTYGSGTDRWRPEYAGEVAWTSEPVDARDLLNRPSGWRISLRERWWGFGLDELPLNGRVWYPEGELENLPLVLVVHGNHDMMRFSDPGYAWIGEHLASRGHVVVSVDQNFMNGSVFGGLRRENGTRGWLMLRHLAAWREWAEAPDHPLQARVSTDRVVLIGHSRGGEAVALAAAFNRLPHFPEDAGIEFDFGFGIQGIAAIAPVDGQFRASGKPTRLDDVSYFVIHGGHDADVSSFSGDRQLRRTRPDIRAGRFSASLYVHHANHGQFNTRWGDSDAGGVRRHLLNRAALMSGHDQRRVGLLYLTGFVEAALARPDAIAPYFCDARAAGRLLPETLYVNRCDDGRRVVLADFEQGLDLTRGSLPGTILTGRGLARWSEGDVGFRGRSRRRQTGVFLGWHARDENGANGQGPDSREARPAYTIELDDGARERLSLSADSVLWLDLAQADRSPPENGDSEAGQNTRRDNSGDDAGTGQAGDGENGDGDLRHPVRFSIELEDIHGNRSTRPLSDFAELLPPLPVRHTRLKMLDEQRYRSPTEPVLKSVAIPLGAFATEPMSLQALGAIHLRFDDSVEGVLIIERISVDPGRPGKSLSGDY